MRWRWPAPSAATPRSDPTSARNCSTSRSLALPSHGLADDTAGRPEGEVGDLATHLGQGALLLALDLGDGLLAQPLELALRRGQLALAGLIGQLLGTLQDLVRLVPRLVRVLRRSRAAWSRSWRAASASRRPCSTRCRRSSSIRSIGPIPKR